MVFSVRGSVMMRLPLVNSREGLFKAELVLALGRLQPAEPKVAVGGEVDWRRAGAMQRTRLPGVYNALCNTSSAHVCGFPD
jgi:hypothetical protein